MFTFKIRSSNHLQDMQIPDITSRLQDIEKSLFTDPSQIKDPAIFDFAYYLLRNLMIDNTKYPLDIVTHIPDILEATLDKLIRDIEV